MAKQKRYKITWSDDSLITLDEIFLWNREKFSVRRAEKILKSIKLKSEKIRNNPYLYPIYLGKIKFEYEVRMALIQQTYRMLYLIDNDEIYIIDLIHTSRNIDVISLIGLN